MNEAVPISGDDVVDRIVADESSVLLGKNSDVPKDGSQEESELQQYRDDLAEVTEEDDH